MTATAMWGPIIAWCALETLADSIDPEKPEQVALDLFDRLRLRQPLAESFTRLGFEGETGWRAAARIKVVLLDEAEAEAAREVSLHPTSIVPQQPSIEVKPPTSLKPAVGKPDIVEQTAQPTSEEKAPVAVASQPNVAGLPRALWSDADVRWLTGVHDAEGHTWFVCEPYEELLWWLQMPALLSIANESSPNKAELQALSQKVHAASAEADKAEYRLDVLLAPEASPAEPEKEVAAGGHSDSSLKHSIQKPEPLASTSNAAEDSIVKEDLPITKNK
jgi:hypothetical protein